MFYFDYFHGKKILKSSILSDLTHFFTTRDFVLTEGSLSELKNQAEENRNFLIKNMDISKSNLITVKQTHSDNIKVYDGETSFYDNCDSVITAYKESAVILNFADCVPIILFDSKINVAAVIHAGWRGTAAHIAAKTVRKITKNFNSNPSDIKAAIGPAIGKCCFYTDKDVKDKLIDNNNFDLADYNPKTDKYHIDLKKLNERQLLDIGLKEIDVCGYCTSCMSDIFFSYRKENGITARHSAVIKLKQID